MNEIIIFETKKLKNEAKLFVFIITKAYLASEIFQKDWKEAIELKKDILILLKEECSHLSNHQFANYKVINVNKAMIEKTMYENISLFNKKNELSNALSFFDVVLPDLKLLFQLDRLELSVSF